MIHSTILLKDKARKIECLPPVTHCIWYWGYCYAYIGMHLTWGKSDSCPLWVAEDCRTWTTYSNKPVSWFSESVPGDKLRAVLSFLFLVLIQFVIFLQWTHYLEQKTRRKKKGRGEIAAAVGWWGSVPYPRTTPPPDGGHDGQRR